MAIELVNSDTNISTTSNNKTVLTPILFNNTSLANQKTENKEKTNIEINVNLSASHGSAIE
ncbi:hypothetical protein [uncultured Gilliamella sp.]|uniref:hypothetical protein n=1 Tax=uncultured Gilliamella sp. TaxID=1193505 RepID=UPI0025F87FB5|nr:hypothetical protein [uncultured Gilliamella sp.]